MSTPPEPILPEAPRGLVAEFADFLIHEKVWWMTPIVVVLGSMVGFIFFAEAVPLLPYVYLM